MKQLVVYGATFDSGLPTVNSVTFQPHRAHMPTITAMYTPSNPHKYYLSYRCRSPASYHSLAMDVQHLPHKITSYA